jgi:hypothetical protein
LKRLLMIARISRRWIMTDRRLFGGCCSVSIYTEERIYTILNQFLEELKRSLLLFDFLALPKILRIKL